jgi:PEGA domain
VSFRTANCSGRSWAAGVFCAAMLLIVAGPGVCLAQGKTDSTPSTSGGTSAAGATSSPTANAKAQAKSPYITASDGAVDAANRKALEENAGPQGGKLLIRSVPTGARAFVDDNYVGHTPLLLIVAPGKYKIQVQGTAEDSGKTTVELGPKETRQVALTLTARYPNHVAAR